MAESQSMVRRHQRQIIGSLEEEHGSVEVAAQRRDVEAAALREGGVGEAKRRREDPADAGDNFCVLYREWPLRVRQSKSP